MKIFPSKETIIPSLIMGILAVIIVKKVSFLNNL